MSLQQSEPHRGVLPASTLVIARAGQGCVQVGPVASGDADAQVLQSPLLQHRQVLATHRRVRSTASIVTWAGMHFRQAGLSLPVLLLETQRCSSFPQRLVGFEFISSAAAPLTFL